MSGQSDCVALPITIKDVEVANSRVKDHLWVTPLLSTPSLITRAQGHQVFLKCENLQRTGSFKSRGALNAIQALGEQARQGVVTHSSGNFAQALAWAARQLDIPAYAAVPEGTPVVKLNAAIEYGGQPTFCANTYESRLETASQIARERGAVLIPSYDDELIMAGQGTAGLEIADQLPEVDVVVCPISGGGLISGIATAMKARVPECVVIGAEPAGANDAQTSLRNGSLSKLADVDTIADGLRVPVLGTKCWPVVKALVDDVITTTDAEIAATMKFMMERTKMVVEPSGACAYSALCNNDIFDLQVIREKFGSERRPLKIVAVVSGGNVDLTKIPEYFQLI